VRFKGQANPYRRIRDGKTVLWPFCPLAALGKDRYGFLASEHHQWAPDMIRLSRLDCVEKWRGSGRRDFFGSIKALDVRKIIIWSLSLLQA
jgi:hypothetical protein